MRIAVLSDSRLPTSIDTLGHGLGRSAARLAEGLAQRGHAVTLYGAPGSYAAGCIVIADTDEDRRAAELAQSGAVRYDAYLDSTHHFVLSRLSNLPIVNKVCDEEDTPPRCVVYPSRRRASLHTSRPELDRVIFEGIDVGRYSLHSGPRAPYLVTFATHFNYGWKRLDMCIDTARLANYRLIVLGANNLPLSVEQRVPVTRTETEYTLAYATALIGWTPTYGFLEAAALGTPSLGTSDDDDLIIQGATGFKANTPSALAEVITSGALSALQPANIRFQVASSLNIERQVNAFNAALVDVAEGRWW